MLIALVMPMKQFAESLTKVFHLTHFNPVCCFIIVPAESLRSVPKNKAWV